MNRREAAVKAAEEAVDLAHGRSDLYREAHAYRAMGLAYENFREADVVQSLNGALRLFRQLGSKTDESIILSELATAYDRLGNPGAALRAIDRASLSLSPDDHSRGFLLARRAAALLWSGRVSETYAAIQESLALLRRYGDRIGEGRTLRLLADVHTISGRYRDAIAADGRGLQIAKQANDTRLTVSILNSLITGVYSRLGLIHRAQATFDSLVELMGLESHESYRILAEDSLSAVYLQAGKWLQARILAEHALQAAAIAGREWYASAETRLHLAQALLEMREYVAATEHLLISLRYHRSSGELPNQAFENALLAIAAINLRDHRGGQDYLRESLRVFHRIDILQDSHQLLWMHGWVWTRLGSVRQANRAFRAAYAELNRIAASLGGPLRRRFLSLPFQRRVLEAVGMAPSSAMPAKGGFVMGSMIAVAETRSPHARRQAVLQALSDPTARLNRRTLAAAFGVTPRTITNDIAALRRAGHQIVTATTVH
jgi:tetratricopeptide (TPR) repeat protein